nr:hypothetical protein [Candidatus Sigynarchaeota archaeon]
MEHETQKAKDGTIISWVIAEIAPGQEVEITHSIKGQGDAYSLKNIEVKVFN